MKLAEQISDRIANGLNHPGYPNTEQPPSIIRLPLFALAGQPPEMTRQVNETVKMIGEAIVYELGLPLDTELPGEGETVLILREELDQLRAELAQLKEKEQPK
jgi:hypothetical protein